MSTMSQPIEGVTFEEKKIASKFPEFRIKKTLHTGIFSNVVRRSFYILQYFYVLEQWNILEYTNIVVVNVNYRILDIEGHSSKYIW